MIFLAPFFLIGLAAAAVPLLLHLRRARQSVTIAFSTNEFFDERFFRAARRAKIQDMLLMLFRMALPALLALALAQPLLRGAGFGVFGRAGEPRRVAVVLDDSASMGARARDGVLFVTAREAALESIAELSPLRGDRATVVLAGRREAGPVVLFEEPTPDMDRVRAALNGVALTDLASDLDAAVEAAAEALGTSGGAGRREIHVFSDLQDGALRGSGALNAGPGVGLMITAIRPGPREQVSNVSVDAVQYGAARPVPGVPFQFRAMLTNHGDEPRTATASLVVGERVVGERQVELPARRSRLVRFTHAFDAPGWFGGRVEAAAPEGDVLPADDARHFALRVDDRVRVLAVNGAPSQIRRNDELFFLRLALGAGEPGAAVQLEEIRPRELTAERAAGYPLILLANVAELTAPALEAIEHYVDRGGGLLISLGDRVRPDSYNGWAGGHRLHGGLLPARLGELRGGNDGPPGPATQAPADTDDGSVFIASVDEEHPMLAGFGPGRLGSLAHVRLALHYRLLPRAGARVLMRDADGQALLVEGRFGRGRVLLFASTIDRDWTNFPLDPTYVPWVYRAVSYLSQQAAPDANFILTGQTAAAPAAAAAAESLRLEGPGNRMSFPEPHPRLAGGPPVFADIETAGIYALRRGDAARDSEPLRLLAANIPADASRLDYLDEVEVRARLHHDTAMAYIERTEASGAPAVSVRHGRGLWDQLLWLALIVALFEPWLANRLSRRRAARVPDALDKREPVAAWREAWMTEPQPAETAVEKG